VLFEKIDTKGASTGLADSQRGKKYRWNFAMISGVAAQQRKRPPSLAAF
jgi:hypothetical protein